ncbi:MAG TPA: RNA ligase (ATP) [Thermotogota bacterium]|nr:RNA ligase (ATP) [Thermotogota bacterium]
MRQLATIRKISNITKIDGADFIELATIDNWNVIIEKNKYQVNDKIIYCEIDSFLPIKPQYEFLRKSSYKKLYDGSEGFRIKTMKMKGVYSQGLVLSLDVLPLNEYNEYDDVTDLLNIKLYEEPVKMNGNVRMGTFPQFLYKTDEPRIQNLNINELVNLHTDLEVTEKLDGTSATYYNYNNEIGICSRNNKIEIDDASDDVYNYIFKKYDLANVLNFFIEDYAIQGEIIGPGIQNNNYKLKEPEFYIFNIFDINKQRYLLYNEISTLVNNANELRYKFNDNWCELKQVPYHTTVNTAELLTINDYFNLIPEKSILNKNSDIEGIVLRSAMRHNVRGIRFNNFISFKVISNKFLLKHENN